jgi:hypothetical protein
LAISVPQTAPNVSTNVPPAIGIKVLIIETDEDRTPYLVLSM